MNVKATLSPDDLARACAEAMWKEDDASKGSAWRSSKSGRPRDAGDDDPAAHGQWPRHRPWRLHLHAGGFGLRLCLQLPQRARGGGAVQHHLHPARQARRPAGRDRARNLAKRAFRASTTCVSPSMTSVIAELRGHSRTIGGAGCRWPTARSNKNRSSGNAPWPRPKLNPGRSGYSAEMDDAERASRDEIMALQTKRLAWSLAHAYDNVAHYKKAFDKAGVHPSDFRQLSDLAKFPVHGQDRSARQLSVQHVRGRRAKSWSASTPPPAPPASRSWSAIPGPISISGRR